MTIITDIQAQIVACLLSGITLNVGKIMYSEWRYFRNYGGTYLLLPSLITELCKRAQVEECATDTWVPQGPRIFPLKFIGEGA